MNDSYQHAHAVKGTPRKVKMYDKKHGIFIIAFKYYKMILFS